MATQMLTAGAPIVIVSQRLRQSRTSTTLNVYAHAVPGGDRSAAQVLSATGGLEWMTRSPSELARTQKSRRPSTSWRGGTNRLSWSSGAGQAEVVRAWDHRHSRPVALKVRRLQPGVDREVALGEARALLAVRPHPGIAVIRDDHFAGDDEHHLVLDWISGDVLPG